ncbi:Glycoside hydrolase family 28 protein [Pleurostoma richardsiae]|uniref:Glycoside hydrolase family 28 protein n=1 Tax=Pleurostoma richardsiae TaxID=41990 RepID=A0AA38RVR3_9PEZI|nr:Glycoside hydrolase family 28 protein [Pleurostoma richardsiae]
MSVGAACWNNYRLVFAVGQTYNLLAPIHFSKLESVEFLIEGNISLPRDIEVTEAVINNTHVYPGHWITVSSSQGVTVTGSKDLWAGWFLGHGELWWPMANNRNNDARPHFFSFKVTSSRLRNVKVLDPVADRFFFNTVEHGIDLSASDFVIDRWTSRNGGDVINVAPPAADLTRRNAIAYGTHGVAVSCSSGTGSGSPFENMMIYNSLIGARFKGSLAAYARNFRWENIVATASEELRDGSCISGPCWSHTAGESPSKALYILCKDANHCQDFHFENLALFGAGGDLSVQPGEMDCAGLEASPGWGSCAPTQQ